MEIVFTWSWLAFFAGVVATLTVLFWLVVGLAWKQYNKGKKAKNNIEDLFKGWSGGPNK